MRTYTNPNAKCGKAIRIKFKLCFKIQSKLPKFALRCYPRCTEDGIIRWKDNALNIVRLINASGKPYSSVFCYYENNKLIIWDAELVEDVEHFCAIPGQVTKIDEGFCAIACEVDMIRI